MVCTDCINEEELCEACKYIQSKELYYKNKDEKIRF